MDNGAIYLNGEDSGRPDFVVVVGGVKSFLSVVFYLRYLFDTL
jgi:hypothetical protein